ncbi:MAG: hypothetical protein HY002_03380 [Candidatus Rokubacteria bacterium]|nr:hypothetical protein [Candidatus Rokubacteria bacterium]
MRVRAGLLTFGVLAVSLLGAVWAAPILAGSAARHAGTVVEVDAAARSLVLEEMGAGGKTLRLHLRIPEHVQPVLSERLPDSQVADLTHPFRETPIGLGDIRTGDFIVVELSGDQKTAAAGSVTLTFRPGAQ